MAYGRYTPSTINPTSRWRFFRERHAEMIRRIGGGPPDERQALAIRMLIESEWDMRRAQHDADTATKSGDRYNALRLAADARKQVLLWDRALTAATPKPEPASAPQPTFDQVLADIARRRSEPDGDEEAA